MSKATERELRSIQKKQKHMMSVKRDNPDGNTAGMQNGAIPLTVASKKAPRKNTLSIDEVGRKMNMSGCLTAVVTCN